jgi:hypothetical protein
MIEGIILGCITWLSIMLTWSHLPNPLKRFTRNHPVMSDLTGSIIVYLVLSSVSKSLVAVIGAIVAGLLINFTILGANKSDEYK